MGDGGVGGGLCASALCVCAGKCDIFRKVMMVCNNQDIEVDRGRTKGQEKKEAREEKRGEIFLLFLRFM